MSFITSNENAKMKNEILKKQQESTAKLQSLLEKSTQALTCGPDCQKEKVLSELNQKYLDAKTNLQIAPITLEQTKKNYYVFKEGRPYYDNMLETELTTKAEELSTILSDNFSEELANAKSLNNMLSIDIINSNNTFELYNEYVSKNAELKNIIGNSNADILTNDRKTYYESQEYESIQKWYKRFIWMYYILVLVFLLGVILSPTQMSRISLIIIFVLLVIYPFVIHRIVQTLGGFITTTLGYLPTNVYNNL